MLYLSNAFSLQMIPHTTAMGCLRYVEISRETASDVLSRQPFTSIVGHQSTADVLSEELRAEVLQNRVSVVLEPHDMLLVAQLCGGRLPEGATTLPEGATFRYLLLKLDGEVGK